jgi:hypothetical protein
VKRYHEPCQQEPGWCVRPGTPAPCLGGHYYSQECQGGHPVLLGTDVRKITSLAAQGVAFTKIARQAGHTLGTVREVVHGVRNVRLVVRA